MALPLPQIHDLIRNLREVTLQKWGWRAMREAVLEWRDAKKPPGGMIRFRRRGERFYRFKGRFGKRNNKRLYVKHGDFEKQLAKRRPRRKKVGQGRVAARFSLGGGPMNALQSFRPVVGRRAVTRRETVELPAGPVSGYTRFRDGGRESVDGYQMPTRSMTIVSTVYHPVYAAESWAKQFGWDRRDYEFIIERYWFHLEAIVRKAAISPKGKYRAKFMSKHLEKHDGKRS